MIIILKVLIKSKNSAKISDHVAQKEQQTEHMADPPNPSRKAHSLDEGWYPECSDCDSSPE